MMKSVVNILCLCFLHITWSEQDIGDPCTTSIGENGICKPQDDCLALQNSTKNEPFSETCHLGTDGTPIVCCIMNTETTEPIAIKFGDTPKDAIETRAFNGPRKKQYILYKTVYKEPIKNLYTNYDQALYNEIYQQTAFQIKNSNLDPAAYGLNQFSNYNPGYSQPSNYPNNYSPFANQNNFPSGNSIPEFSNVNFNKPTPKTTTRPYQPVTDGVNFRPTNRPIDGVVNFRPVNSVNRPGYENGYNRPTTPGYKPVNPNYHEEPPVWGGTSEPTTRRIRTPKPTSSTNSNEQNGQNQQNYQNQQNQQNQQNYQNQQNQQNQQNYQNQQNQQNYQNQQNQQNQQNHQNQQNQQNQQRQRISQQKCAEYSKIVTHTISAVPLTFNSQATSLNVEDCPVEAVQLVVGGKKAELGEYPHMAALGFKSGSSIEYNCGGTLISEDYVLTAAHCTHSSLGNPIHVRLGDLNLEREDDGAQPQVINVQQTIVHPNYKSPQLYNDIALIKLSRRVSFTKYLRPGCLHTSRNINAEKVIATGWGSTNYGETSSDTLLKVGLNVIENRRCNSLYGTDSRLKNGITDTMMCAGDLSGNKDTCQGDSGGPLQIISPTNKCIQYIVGITSFGKSCGVQNSPGIYTRVFEYIDWIENIVWRNNN